MFCTLNIKQRWFISRKSEYNWGHLIGITLPLSVCRIFLVPCQMYKRAKDIKHNNWTAFNEKVYFAILISHIQLLKKNTRVLQISGSYPPQVNQRGSKTE